MLVQNGADTNVVDDAGLDPLALAFQLFEAAYNSQPKRLVLPESPAAIRTEQMCLTVLEQLYASKAASKKARSTGFFLDTSVSAEQPGERQAYLECALRSWSSVLVSALLRYGGCNVDGQNGSQPPLFWCLDQMQDGESTQRAAAVVEALLNANANPNVTFNEIRPLDIAVGRGNRLTEALLIRHQAQHGEFGIHHVLDAMEKQHRASHNLSALEERFDRLESNSNGCNVDAMYNGQRAVHRAAAAATIGPLQKLVSSGKCQLPRVGVVSTASMSVLTTCGREIQTATDSVGERQAVRAV